MNQFNQSSGSVQINATQRRNAPYYEKSKTKQIRIKSRLSHALAKKNFNKDTSLSELRENGGEINLYFKLSGAMKKKKLPARRSNIRIERIETLRELGFAFIDNCNYSIDSEYFFEISYPPETLAKMIGQHHFYSPSKKHPNGRSSYDCVLNALYDYEASGQIVIVRQYDKKAGTNKASRIYLTPIFFKMLGVKRKEMLDLMRELKRVKALHGKLKGDSNYQREQASRRNKEHRIAKIERTDIKKILSSIKCQFLIEDKLSVVHQSKEKTASKTQSIPIKPRNNLAILNELKSKLPPALFYIEKMNVDLLQLPKEDSVNKLIQILQTKLH